MRTSVRMTIVCVLLDRFELAVAAGGRAGLLGEPAALAPEPGRELFVGEVSQAAEAFGIHAGMRMGEALSRCPRLALVPPDPMGVAEAWERALARLESLGAAVESLRPGEACFDARGLERLHAGRVVRMLADGYLAAQGAERLRRVLAGPRVGQGPTRFCAMVAASRRARAPARRRSPARPTSPRIRSRCCAAARETAALVEPFERLGIATLGEPRGAAAQRGRRSLRPPRPAGPRPRPRAATRRCAPRLPGELLREALELPESGSGEQLGPRARAAHRPPARAPRAARAHAARRRARRRGSSRAARGASASSSARRSPTRSGCGMVLGGRLALLPAPAETLAADRRALRPAASRGAARCSTTARRAATSACARRSARRAPSPGPTRRCACSRSIPTRACPSAASC